MTLRENTKSILDEYGLRLTKLRGQHLLVNKRILDKIMATASIQRGQFVVEIGPGIGTLTDRLLRVGAKVFAIEIDVRMQTLLQKRFANEKQLELVKADAVQFFANSKQRSQLPDSYTIVANLPYQITTPLLWEVLTSKHVPESITIMIQREVALRIMAKVPKINLLAVLVQSFGDVKRVTNVSKSAFLPQPRVESTVIKITRRSYNNETRDRLLQLAKAGFKSPRKKCLTNFVSAGYGEKKVLIAVFERLGIDPSIRAQQLSLDDWQRLAKSL